MYQFISSENSFNRNSSLWVGGLMKSTFGLRKPKDTVIYEIDLTPNQIQKMGVPYQRYSYSLGYFEVINRYGIAFLDNLFSLLHFWQHKIDEKQAMSLLRMISECLDCEEYLDRTKTNASRGVKFDKLKDFICDSTFCKTPDKPEPQTPWEKFVLISENQKHKSDAFGVLHCCVSAEDESIPYLVYEERDKPLLNNELNSKSFSVEHGIATLWSINIDDIHLHVLQKLGPETLSALVQISWYISNMHTLLTFITVASAVNLWLAENNSDYWDKHNLIKL